MGFVPWVSDECSIVSIKQCVLRVVSAPFLAPFLAGPFHLFVHQISAFFFSFSPSFFADSFAFSASILAFDFAFSLLLFKLLFNLRFSVV